MDVVVIGIGWDSAARVDPAQTIILAAGTYTLSRPLELTQLVQLVGEGIDQTEVTSAAPGYTVRFAGQGAFSAKALTFRHTGEAEAAVVVVQGGEVSFSRCRFSGATYAGTDVSVAGLRIEGDTVGVVKDCVAEGNDRNGILVRDRAQLTLEGNRCTENRGAGIAYWDDAGGLARQNVCTKNQDFGIVLFGRAQPTLEQNCCTENNGAGIAYEGSSAGVARQNDCSRNYTPGDQCRRPGPTDD